MQNQIIINHIANETGIAEKQIRATVGLFLEGATIPFVARYRKEKTGGLDEVQIKTIQERYNYYEELGARKETILKTIEEQEKLTPELKNRIEKCFDKQTLEDIYLPYKPKRKTKADIAIEKGYKPLADFIWAQNGTTNLEAGPDAIKGAQDIMAQQVSDTAEYRQYIRRYVFCKANIVCKVTKDWFDKKSKFEMYYNFSENLAKAASHRVLAIRRGTKEKVISWKLVVKDEELINYLESKVVKNPSFVFAQELKEAIADAYKRLIFPSIQTECFTTKVLEAETESIKVFSTNLKNLLLFSPVGQKEILGLDPGFRTGCKVAAIDDLGNYQGKATIFPTEPFNKIKEATEIVLKLIKDYKVKLVAIGNGTASKETMQFIKKMFKDHKLDVIPVIVNEAGASVYSASEIAQKEFPNLDLTVRGAISIARRLQDPLAELVKIDPKAIGVGQYQHDVNQVNLKESLDFTTEFCVNFVGVDLNTASSSLLSYVSGIGPVLAENIVQYRNQNGAFKNRKTLKKVTKLGPKAFEQCAGFLRVKNGDNPLDNTGIHPESYNIAKKIVGQLETVNLNEYVTEEVGLPTLKDIKKELEKPGLDPREEFSYAKFDDNIDDIKDLKKGMVLEGVVTNVTNFGAFTDIGVHQDGLIHISQLSDTFVKNPADIVSAGQCVKVEVIGLDLDLKRIQLKRI
ncbi:RNA-binding transcriptional accessory protein [bacterium]|jgi:protein Tex|nr:RNA-binding transcriptional accessory protein [bacterium]MBT7088478.1 RNA-binding transcriptional accessory protein [bacterium]